MEATTERTERRDRVATLAVFLGVTFGAMALVSLPVVRFLPAPIRNLLPFQGSFAEPFLSPDRGLTPSQAAAVGEVIDRLTGGGDGGTTSIGEGVAIALADGGSGSSDGAGSGSAAAGRGGNRFTGVHHDGPQPAPKGRDGISGPRDRTPDEPAPDEGQGRGPARGDDGGDDGKDKGADDGHGKAKGKDDGKGKDDDGEKDEGKGKKGKGKGKGNGKH